MPLPVIREIPFYPLHRHLVYNVDAHAFIQRTSVECQTAQDALVVVQDERVGVFNKGHGQEEFQEVKSQIGPSTVLERIVEAIYWICLVPEGDPEKGGEVPKLRLR